MGFSNRKMETEQACGQTRLAELQGIIYPGLDYRCFLNCEEVKMVQMKHQFFPSLVYGGMALG